MYKGTSLEVNEIAEVDLVFAQWLLSKGMAKVIDQNLDTSSALIENKLNLQIIDLKKPRGRPKKSIYGS